MPDSISFLQKTSEPPPWKEKLSVINKTFSKVDSNDLIRFEERKGIYTWVQPEGILFVKSADHYVKALIQQGIQKKWTMRHCTIKDLTSILSDNNFIRLNKFYMINRTRFSHVDVTNKTIFLDDGFSVPISHRISGFMIKLLAS
jgi:DNA-binding LytR/AlgR family response regulator